MLLLWLVPTAVASSLDTLADLISDEVVAGEDSEEEEEVDEEAAKKLLGDQGESERLLASGVGRRRPCCCPEIPQHQKLTGEQDFMVSMVPMLCASLVIGAWQPEGTTAAALGGAASPFALASALRTVAIIAAGLAYAVGYLALLKAWESVPSTVIVPCLQLSSPMVELMEAALAPHHALHPFLRPLASSSALTLRSVVAFLVVFVGGIMPSVGEGSVAQLWNRDLWRQKSMVFMMGGNLAFSTYYVIMGLVTSPAAATDFQLTNAQFMACTNVVAVVAFSSYVACSPTLRRQFASAYNCGCRVVSHGHQPSVRQSASQVHWAARVMSMLAECCNYAAMLAISFAFNMHPNAGLVAAGRSSMNQVTNCVFAWFLYRCYRFGRPVEKLALKLLSSLVVCCGLLLASL